MKLFNDYKNRYYRCIQNIINGIYNGEKYTKKDIRAILQDAYLEDEIVLVKELVDGRFFDYEDDTASLMVGCDVPIRLNNLELAYLKMFVEDECFNGVLDDELLQKLKDKLDDVESLDYNKFWKRENVDKFGDDIKDEEFREKIITLEKAILENKYIKYTSKNKKGEIFKDKIAYPYKIEYSIKNNRYRLVVFCDNRAIKINVDGIMELEILKEKTVTAEEKAQIENFINAKKNISDPLVLKIEDNKNTLDRCFNLFSAYDKKYYYEGENLILNIYYHDFDKAEIIRDILSLGKSAVVLSPESVREEVIKRILRNF